MGPLEDEGLSALFGLSIMLTGLVVITIATLIEYKVGRPNFVTKFLCWLAK